MVQFHRSAFPLPADGAVAGPASSVTTRLPYVTADALFAAEAVA